MIRDLFKRVLKAYNLNPPEAILSPNTSALFLIALFQLQVASLFVRPVIDAGVESSALQTLHITTLYITHKGIFYMMEAVLIAVLMGYYIVLGLGEVLYTFL